MIKLYSPENEIELLILKSIFDSEKIHYYVLNDYFGSMKVGPKIELYNDKIIYVSDNDFKFAQELLADYLKNLKTDDVPFKSQYSIPDKIRFVLEVLLCGWFMPGNRWGHNKLNEKFANNKINAGR